MQEFGWDDLKVALAVFRDGSLAQAARHLGVNETTVARRIRALEHRLGGPLFLPGPVRDLTEIGAAVIHAAEQVESTCQRMGDEIGLVQGQLAGHVRVTSVPMIVNRILVPQLPTLLEPHPELRVDLIPDAQNLSLTRREADLAIRFGRPVTGGTAIVTRKLGEIRFAVFGRANAPTRWIGYDEAFGHLAQARWLAAQGAPSGLRVCDVETACEAALAGLGLTLLPVQIGRAAPELEERPDVSGLPAREIWMVSHKGAETRAVSVAKEWLLQINWSGDQAR